MWNERRHQEYKRFYWKEEGLYAQIDGFSGQWSYSVYKGGERQAFGFERTLTQAKYYARNHIRSLGGDK